MSTPIVMSSNPSSESDRTPVDTAIRAESADPVHRPVPWLSWLMVAILTAGLTGVTGYQAIRQYQELRSGWSWDLAYNNQWFWALTEGDQILSIRPVSAFGQEGPSIWKMNHLGLIRLVIAPLYRMAPGPLILLVIQNVVFWWVIPAAYTLVRSETRSEGVAVSAAALVPLTPLFWPLVWNDFRELQLAGPFVLWAVQGVRSRLAGWTVLGIVGMLACRQEYAIMIATFAFLPPREPETLSATLLWRRSLFLVGLLWMMFGYFGYLRFMAGPGMPNLFMNQFLGPKAPINETLETSLEALLLGMGAWAVLACLVPRVAILAIPWISGPCSGQWAMRMLSTSGWHTVRYMMPMAIMVLAAGLIGYARLANGLLPRRFGRVLMVATWVGACLVCSVGLRDVTDRLSQVPVEIDRQEAEQIWSWVRQVGADDAVMVDYELSAPLSSRRLIFACEMDENLPGGFPNLGPEFRWLFIRNTNRFYKPMLAMGFDVVHHGKYATIARRR